MFAVRHWNWKMRDYSVRTDNPFFGPMRDEVFLTKEEAFARAGELAKDKFGEDAVEEDGKGWIIRESEEAFRNRSRFNKYVRQVYRTHRWWYRVDPCGS